MKKYYVIELYQHEKDLKRALGDFKGCKILGEIDGLYLKTKPSIVSSEVPVHLLFKP